MPCSCGSGVHAWETIELNGRSWTWATTSPGLRTEASHVLTRSGEGTIAEQSIIWSGPLGRVAAFVWRSLTRRYLAIEAAGLKRHSEELFARSRTGQK